MDAKELRIGNWIEAVAKMGNYFMQVQLMHISAINENPHCANPIPLSHTSLLMCGFERESELSFISKQSNFISIREQGSWTNGKPALDNRYVLYKNYAGAIAEVKYLHQLQNLFFAITGEELKVTILQLA